MIFILADVCAELKNRHGCGPGSKHEKFMKKHCRKTFGLCKMLVFVTGGRGEGGILDSTELLNMDGTWNCPMPTMPKPRLGHTQTGLVTCGGHYVDSAKSCVTFISGSVNWEKTHTLAKRRGFHSAWDSSQGINLTRQRRRHRYNIGDTAGEWRESLPLGTEGQTFMFSLISRVLEHIQRNFS